MAWHWANLDASHARSIAWKDAHSGRVKQYSDAYYQEHAQERRANAVAWYWAHVERRKAYRVANAGRAKAYNASRYVAKRDQIRAVHDAWVAANPDRRKAITKSWKQGHPGLVRAQMERRKRNIEVSGGNYTGAEWGALKEQYDYRCLMCGRREPEIKLTVDHVIPLSKGGRNDIQAIQPLCLVCNLHKGRRILDLR
jgi:5-methylcytosine-specific restriction endonuclease McrA